MVLIPHSRILVGPLDGHLSNQAVRDMFSPYGEVLGGGYYHHIASTHSTYGFVDMDTENSAKRAIRGLINGRFVKHGKRIRMTRREAVGPLPMRMDDWDDATFWGSVECKTDGVDRSEATESSNKLKGSDAADVHTETVELEDGTDIGTSDSARKVKDSVGDVEPWDIADIERDRDSSVYFQQPRHKTVDAGKKEAAAESSALLPSSKRKRSERKEAKARKKEKSAL